MTIIQNKLNLLFRDLKEFLNKKKIISRIELRLKIKELIVLYNFSDSERKEFEDLYEYPLQQFIFLTITSGTPSSIQAPLLHEKLEYKQSQFYHSHTFSLTPELLENAYLEVCQIHITILKSIITQFLTNAKYIIDVITTTFLFATCGQFNLKVTLFSSILDLIDRIKTLELTPNNVLIIPTGVSINPFVEFYQKYSNQILLTEANVWLVDPESETVSRFIGIPKDKNLLNYFAYSQLSTQIERIWRPTLSEDF